jgi:hypothetical protein
MPPLGAGKHRDALWRSDRPHEMGLYHRELVGERYRRHTVGWGHPRPHFLRRPGAGPQGRALRTLRQSRDRAQMAGCLARPQPPAGGDDRTGRQAPDLAPASQRLTPKPVPAGRCGALAQHPRGGARRTIMPESPCRTQKSIPKSDVWIRRADIRSFIAM